VLFPATRRATSLPRPTDVNLPSAETELDRGRGTRPVSRPVSRSMSPPVCAASSANGERRTLS